MPALNFFKRKKYSKNFRRLIVSIPLIVLPVALLIASVFLYFQNAWRNKDLSQQKIEIEGQMLRPSQVVGDKYRYMDKSITLKGKVSQLQVVCQRTKCPAEDPCCGCPQTRDLVMTDVGVSVLKESGGYLKLVDAKKKPLCQRLPASCDYQCLGWVDNGIYEVEGIFYGEPPPLGSSWKSFLDSYLVVSNQRLVSRFGFIQKISSLFNNLAEWASQIKSQGFFILD